MTYEGAAAYDYSTEDPLVHLVFTKGSVLFKKTFYRSQQEEVFQYSKALIAAEEREHGFGWKFAHWMRNPKDGKGNRIQGSVAPAILSARYPESEFVQEYVYKCLRYRPDDVMLFASHFTNFGMGDIPEPAKKGMGKAINGFDEYQLLKYSKKEAELLSRRENGRTKTLRLVDAMGVCKDHLDDFHRAMYGYFHAPTTEKDEFITDTMVLTRAQRDLFRKDVIDKELVRKGRVTIEQLLSVFGNNMETWQSIMDVDGLFPDKAFLMNIRNLHAAGFSSDEIIEFANGRSFKGIWMHELFAGFKTMTQGIQRNSKYSGKAVYHQPAVLELTPVFEHIFKLITKEKLPPGKHLGIADISGSMFGVPVGGEHSSIFAGDVACTLVGAMSTTLGYGATFRNDINLYFTENPEEPLAFGLSIKGTDQMAGFGSTQVLGSTLGLIRRLLIYPDIPRPEALWYFSDMQFHPPTDQGSATPEMLQGLPRSNWNPNIPPLEAAIELYRELIGPVDIVLWNLAGYDNEPVKSSVDHVLMVSGFDANTFDLFRKWKESGGKLTVSAGSQMIRKTENQQSTLDHIRTF